MKTLLLSPTIWIAKATSGWFDRVPVRIRMERPRPKPPPRLPIFRLDILP